MIFTKESKEAEKSLQGLVDLRYQQRYGRKPKNNPEVTTPDTKKRKQIEKEVRNEMKNNTSVNPTGAIKVKSPDSMTEIPKPEIKNYQPARPMSRRKNITKYSA